MVLPNNRITCFPPRQSSAPHSFTSENLAYPQRLYTSENHHSVMSTLPSAVGPAQGIIRRHQISTLPSSHMPQIQPPAAGGHIDGHRSGGSAIEMPCRGSDIFTRSAENFDDFYRQSTTSTPEGVSMYEHLSSNRLGPKNDVGMLVNEGTVPVGNTTDDLTKHSRQNISSSTSTLELKYSSEASATTHPQRRDQRTVSQRGTSEHNYVVSWSPC